MAVHHGGKVGKAAKTLASKSSSKSAKSKAGTTLANHKLIIRILLVLLRERHGRVQPATFVPLTDTLK